MTQSIDFYNVCGSIELGGSYEQSLRTHRNSNLGYSTIPSREIPSKTTFASFSRLETRRESP